MEHPRNPIETEEMYRIATTLRRECTEVAGGHAFAYVLYIDQLFDESEIRDRYQQLAALVQPVDFAAIESGDSIEGVAFYRGALLGFRLAMEVLGSDFDKKLMGSEFPVSDGSNIDDPDEDRKIQLKLQAVAMSIVDVSERGYELAEAFHPVLEEWEDSLSPDVKGQRFAKRGFGLVMYQIAKVLESEKKSAIQADLAEMQRLLDAGLPEDAFDRLLRDS